MATPHRLSHHLRVCGLFSAITACFLVYSLIQERLMTMGFGPERERFRHSLFIILVNRLVTCAVAAAALSLAGKTLQPSAPPSLFAIPSLANVISSASQYEALKYVSFPLQALAKCAKTVPVMAWGLVLGGRRYDAVDYSCALAVTLGCGLFVLSGSIAAPPQLHSAATAAAASVRAAVVGAASTGGRDVGAVAAAIQGALPEAPSTRWVVYGLALLAAFLVFDGLTSTAQDRLFAQYEMHSCTQLLWVSLWSAALSLAFLLAGSQLWPAIQFVARHPSSILYILLLSALSSAVQLFIFYTIHQYGALHFALIMTIRQFLSIVLSCLIFSHDLAATQWLGTLLVIGGLVARGMHRGGLERTSSRKHHHVGAVGGGSGPAGLLAPAAARTSSTAALLLPITAIPVISQHANAGQDPSAALGGGGAAAAAAVALKKDSRGIPVDVQAGALASGVSEGGAALRRSPTGGGGGSKGGSGVATRRKALELA